LIVIQDGTSILALWEEGRRLVGELRMDWAIYLFSNFEKMARESACGHAEK